jgi:hypothetical protein
MDSLPLLLVRGGSVGAHPNTGCPSSSVRNQGRSATEQQGQQRLRPSGGGARCGGVRPFDYRKEGRLGTT